MQRSAPAERGGARLRAFVTAPLRGPGFEALQADGSAHA